MPSQRINRINEDVKRELSDIFRDLKDPRISSLVSIVRVEVSGDLSYAKVYVSAFGGEEDIKNTVKGLKSATGYIRHELSERLHIRKIPELRFIADNSIAHGADISRILKDIEISEHETDEEENNG